MEIRIETGSYNEKRYSKPWIARVDFAVSANGEMVFGNWVGTPGYDGVLLLDATPGDIVARGQKDFRNPKYSAPTYYIVGADGQLERVGSKGDAYKLWLERKDAAAAQDPNALEAERQALLQQVAQINARIAEIDALLA